MILQDPDDPRRVRSLWIDDDVAELDPVARLVHRSNLMGRDHRVTNTGGGNTSSKIEERDPVSNAPTDVPWVKGSGGDLRTATRENFASLRMDTLEQLRTTYLNAPDAGPKSAAEDRTVALYPHATFGANPRASSIDTPLHASCLQRHDRGEATFGGARHVALPDARSDAILAEILPHLRGLASLRNRLVNAVDAPRLAERGTACPDHFLRTKIEPLFVDWDPGRNDVAALRAAIDAGVERYRDDYRRYYETFARDDAPPMHDPTPTVVLLPGLGMIALGRTKSESRVTAEFYRAEIEVMRGAESIDRYVGLPLREAFDIESWALEEAELRRMPPEREIARRIVLVVGAGSGIGRPVAERFADEGAHVACADLDTGFRAYGGMDDVIVTAGVFPASAAGGSLAYDASKAAASHLVRELAIELAPLVRLSGLAPATVVEGSAMFPRERVLASLRKYGLDASSEEAKEDLRSRLAAFYAQRTLTRVAIAPADQAEAALLLASRRLSKTTGRIVTVDGA